MSKAIYHVAPTDHSGDLLSLYAQHGEESIEMYANRWPDAGELAVYHTTYIHCYDNIDDAHEHADIYGGKVYAISTDALDGEGIDVVRDNLEFDHPMITERVPESCIALA